MPTPTAALSADQEAAIRQAFISDLNFDEKHIKRMKEYAAVDGVVSFSENGDAYELGHNSQELITVRDDKTNTTWTLTRTKGFGLVDILVGDPDGDKHKSAYLYLEQGAEHLIREFPLDGFDLSVAHFNDLHSYLDSSELKLKVGDQEIQAQVGGVAGLSAAIEIARDDAAADERDFIALQAGDFLEGTLYFNQFGGQVEAKVLDTLDLDAVLLGNHEFSLTNPALAAVVEQINTTVLGANLDLTQSPSLKNEVLPYVILEKSDGQKIGVIGITTLDTFPKNDKTPGDVVTVTDPIAAAKRSVSELQAQGISVIIALSHLGMASKDRQTQKITDEVLAKDVPGIDLIVGGHSHTVLDYDLKSVGDSAWGAYPTLIADSEGQSEIPIVQAGKNGVHLGTINLLFDKDGDVVAYAGHDQVVVISDSLDDAERGALQGQDVVAVVEPDSKIAALVAPFADKIQKYKNTNVVSVNAVLRKGLNTGPGVVMADAMLAATREQGTQIAMTNGTGVRVKEIPAGSLTVGKVYEVFPFNNEVKILTVTGTELKASLESILNSNIKKGVDGPLYVAGLSLVYDQQAGDGAHIKNLKIVAGDGSTAEVIDNQTYKIAVNDFLAVGGDHSTFDKLDPSQKSDSGLSGDTEALIDYLKKKGKIEPPSEQRITIQ